MSSGLSSDQIIKNEIIEKLGYQNGKIRLRIFPEGSNDDQRPFVDGGLTFGENGVLYGSCDAVWYIDNKEYTDLYSKKVINKKPVIGLEGTDCLQRGSSGNAQYQRFHHALGAIRDGLIGVYYLKEGKDSVQVELYEMAYNASKYEKGTYLIIQDLSIIENILNIINKFGEESSELSDYLEQLLDKMHEKWINEKFEPKYKSSWENFAKERSTIIQEDRIIKYAGRSKRNFTDGSQRAGHIAVGEMYLSKYFFYNKRVDYLFLRMLSSERDELDTQKDQDKEWNLLRSEPNVRIRTLDEIVGISPEIKNNLIKIKDLPLKDEALKIFNYSKKIIDEKLRTGEYKLEP